MKFITKLILIGSVVCYVAQLVLKKTSRVFHGLISNTEKNF